MTAALALALLVDAGAAESSLLDPRQIEIVAPEIAAACEGGPPALPPWGADCVRAVVVIWSTESAGTFALPPRGGCGGPMQVEARPGLTAPLWVLRWHSAERWRAGVDILRRKLARVRGDWRRVWAAYNGHPRHRAAYGRRAWRLWTRLKSTRGEAAQEGDR